MGAQLSSVEQRLKAEIIRREKLAKELHDKNIVEEFTEEWDNTLDLLIAIRDDKVDSYLSI